jgi:hypothetical protein
MELNELRDSWNKITTPAFSQQQIYEMLKHNRHPSLRKAKAQVLTETAVLGIFLLLYYDALDGDKKPFYINAILIGTILLNILQQLTVFYLPTFINTATDIRHSLGTYKRQLSRYYIFTIITKISMISGLLLFCTYGISWEPRKSILLAVLFFILALQLFWFQRLWGKRINNLGRDIAYFEAEE